MIKKRQQVEVTHESPPSPDPTGPYSVSAPSSWHMFHPLRSIQEAKQISCVCVL